MRHLIWSVILIPHVVDMNARTAALDRSLVQYKMGGCPVPIELSWWEVCAP